MQTVHRALRLVAIRPRDVHIAIYADRPHACPEATGSSIVELGTLT